MWAQGGPTYAAASNYPLRGGKATCWEGGIRGVGLVGGGARSGLDAAVRGTASDAMVHVTDWLPTLCEAAGCADGAPDAPTGALGGAPAGARPKPLDGVSAWGAIARGEAAARSEFLITLVQPVGGSQEQPALRMGAHKLLGWPPMLFDVEADPRETHDLAKERPQTVAALLARIAQYNHTAVPPCDRLRPDPASDPRRHGGAWMPWRTSVLGNGCPHGSDSGVQSSSLAE